MAEQIAEKTESDNLRYHLLKNDIFFFIGIVIWKLIRIFAARNP